MSILKKKSKYEAYRIFIKASKLIDKRINPNKTYTFKIHKIYIAPKLKIFSTDFNSSLLTKNTTDHSFQK